MDRIDLRTEVKRMNGSLFQPKDMSVARQKPNKAADKIWHEWEVSRPFPIASADIRRLGKDVETAVKLEDDIWGLGDDAYVGTLDIFHQLHCLNLLRQMIFPDDYYDTKHGHEYPNWREAHLTHCVDILMQNIQCSGNLNLVTLHWVETQEAPWPDFSIDRQCFDFEQLTEWRRENSLDLNKAINEVKRPANVTERPAPDKLYEFNNWTNPNHINGANPGEDFIM